MSVVNLNLNKKINTLYKDLELEKGFTLEEIEKNNL